MVVTVLLALALLGGAPPLSVALLAVGEVAPVGGLACLVLLALPTRWRRAGSAGPGAEAQWLGAVASELRGGASLRTALADAATRVPDLDLTGVARGAAAGVPLPELVPTVARALPVTGRVVGPAIRMAATSGGEAAAIFSRLAARASAAAADERERRSDTAGARLSAWMVGAVPAGVLVLAVASGRVGAGAGPLGAAAVALGLALQVLGLGVVVALVRRAHR